jgi:hypothetical protein
VLADAGGPAPIRRDSPVNQAARRLLDDVTAMAAHMGPASGRLERAPAQVRPC